MEATGKRHIKAGKEFDHLFPRAIGTEKRIRQKADVEDTLVLIRKMVFETKGDTAKLAPTLKGDTLYKTCQNIWNFYYSHIQYSKDKKLVEQVRSPKRLWADRLGDCDCFTVAVSQTLLNLNIPHALRITKYQYRSYFQHIYVVVPLDGNLSKPLTNPQEYFTLDCVADKFNYEHPYTEKKDYIMDLNRLDGLSDFEEESLSCNIKGSDASDLHGLGDPDISKVYTLKDGRSIGVDKMGNQYEIELGDPFSGLGKISLRKLVKGIAHIAKDSIKVAVIPFKSPLSVVAKIAKGQNIKTAIKSTVKQDLKDAGNLAHDAAKLFPVAILMRNGILAAMKLNLFHIAARLRYAYWDPATAKLNGWSDSEYKKLKNVVQGLENIFQKAGGEKANLSHAILTGKGNKDGKVPKQGTPSKETLAGLQGLGEPITAASIGVATTALSAIAALIGKIKSPKGCTETPTPPEPTGNAKVDAQQTIIYNGLVTACKGKSAVTALLPSSSAASYSSTGASNLVASGGNIVARGDSFQPGDSSNSFTSNGGSSIPSENSVPSAKPSGKPFDWKPLLIGGGIVAGGIYFMSQDKGKKSSPVSGLSGRRKRTTKKAHAQIKKAQRAQKVTTVNF